MHKQVSSASAYGIHLQAWIPNLVMMLLVNIKKEFLANILLRKKHQIKVRQTWIAEKSFNVLHCSLYKALDKDICFLSN